MPVVFGPPNNFPDDERDHLLQLMRGPAVKILVGPKLLYGVTNQDWRTFCLSKAWLSYHSQHFSNATRGYLLESEEVMIDTDPDIFALFVEFMIRGQYTWRDNFRSYDGIRESAKAWILGDFLEAPKFQNIAMRNLFNTYKGRPRSGIGPEAILYVCENCTMDSPLYRFFQDVTVSYWSDKSVVCHGKEFPVQVQWEELWEKFPNFRDVLLERLGQGCDHIKNLNEYLVEEYEWQINEGSSE